MKYSAITVQVEARPGQSDDRHGSDSGHRRGPGLKIAYERVGEGPPLVFVHGAAEDGRAWQPQLAALADEFTVVAWDEPGAGRSSDLPVDFGLADYAHCLAALIEELALGPAHVAGLSWGGTVALGSTAIIPSSSKL